MAQSQTNVPLAILITELRGLCNAKQTGHFIIMTARKRPAIFKLFQGHIISISHATQSGVEALALLAQEDMGTSTFVELTAQGAPPTTHLSNAEVFRRLGGVPTVAAAVRPTAPAPQRTLSSRDYVALETTLANYIGPIAQLICRQTLETANSFEAAVALLTREIPDKHQAAAFAAAVRSTHARSSDT